MLPRNLAPGANASEAIRELLGSNLDPESESIERRFSLLSSVRPGKCWDSPLK